MLAANRHMPVRQDSVPGNSVLPETGNRSSRSSRRSTFEFTALLSLGPTGMLFAGVLLHGSCDHPYCVGLWLNGFLSDPFGCGGEFGSATQKGEFASRRNAGRSQLDRQARDSLRGAIVNRVSDFPPAISANALFRIWLLRALS